MHHPIQCSWSIRALLAITSVVLNASAANADVNFFRLFKTEAYEQTSNAQPTTLSFASGNADIIYDNNSDLTDAQVTSTSPQSPMTLTPSFPGFVAYSQIYTSSGDLDTDFPNNTSYEYGISGGTLGTQTASLSTPATSLYASQVPFFNGTTYDQLQGVDSTSSFQLNVDGYVAPIGINNPLTVLNIFRVLDGAVVFSESAPNTQTSFVLPANTLDPGTAYTADLVYSSRIDTSGAGFNGATSEVGYDLRTDLNFTTAVPEPTSLVLSLFAVAALFAVRRTKDARR